MDVRRTRQYLHGFGIQEEKFENESWSPYELVEAIMTRVLKVLAYFLFFLLKNARREQRFE